MWERLGAGEKRSRREGLGRFERHAQVSGLAAVWLAKPSGPLFACWAVIRHALRHRRCAMPLARCSVSAGHVWSTRPTPTAQRADSLRCARIAHPGVRAVASSHSSRLGHQQTAVWQRRLLVSRSCATPAGGQTQEGQTALMRRCTLQLPASSPHSLASGWQMTRPALTAPLPRPPLGARLQPEECVCDHPRLTLQLGQSSSLAIPRESESVRCRFLAGRRGHIVCRRSAISTQPGEGALKQRGQC